MLSRRAAEAKHPRSACPAYSLTVLFTGLFAVQVLDCLTHFTGNRVNNATAIAKAACLARSSKIA